MPKRCSKSLASKGIDGVFGASLRWCPEAGDAVWVRGRSIASLDEFRRKGRTCTCVSMCFSTPFSNTLFLQPKGKNGNGTISLMDFRFITLSHCSRQSKHTHTDTESAIDRPGLRCNKFKPVHKPSPSLLRPGAPTGKEKEASQIVQDTPDRK